LLFEGNAVGEIPLDVCLHHHEKIDGSGYRHRLNGENLSRYAKMGAVCDVYDAITSNRPYKRGWDPATSLRKMNKWSAGHFEARIFQAFVKTLGIYPIGSPVRLESGLLGVVCELGTESTLTPTVKTFYCTKRKARVRINLLDLAHTTSIDKTASWEDPENWKSPDLNELWAGENVLKTRSSAA
jgi:hypothetical protein